MKLAAKLTKEFFSRIQDVETREDVKRLVAEIDQSAQGGKIKFKDASILLQKLDIKEYQLGLYP